MKGFLFDAESHRLVIVSKDTDFSNRVIIRTPPPWVVHIRLGNMRKREFHRALARLWPKIEMLIKTHNWSTYTLTVWKESIERMLKTRLQQNQGYRKSRHTQIYVLDWTPHLGDYPASAGL